MMNQTDYTFNAKIIKGPSIKQYGSFNMEGFTRIDVVIPANDSKLVNVNSSELDDIKLYYVARTDEPQAAEGAEGEGEQDAQPAKRVLYYTIGESKTKIYLSDEGVVPPEFHVVLGPGAIRLLCDPPNELCFTNEGDHDADVTILICRETSSDCESPPDDVVADPDCEHEKEPAYEGPKDDYSPEPEYPPERQEPPKPEYPPERQEPPQRQQN